MRTVRFLIPALALSLGMGAAVARDYDDFYGKVESIPKDKVGTWVIGGKSFTTDQRTHLDQDNRRIEVGTCVKVEGALDRQGNFFISEIDAKRDDRRCR